MRVFVYPRVFYHMTPRHSLLELSLKAQERLCWLSLPGKPCLRRANYR